MGCWNGSKLCAACRSSVGARLAREAFSVIKDAFAGKPRSYQGGVVSAEFAAEVEFYEASHFSGFEPGA